MSKSDLAGTVLLALYQLEQWMSKIAKMYGMGPVKHDADCEISEACTQCRCTPDDMCVCTCGKLNGFNG